jgi:hypothetical protein
MLASIHPLGERARGNRWGLTVASYLAGSLSGGAALGALVGSAGLRAPAVMIAGLCIAAAAVDASGRRLPGFRRQVDENWLPRYRGWVYGMGFGFQLGLGLVTIVTTAAVYLTFALALLSGSAAAGALIGAAFGVARALPLLALARVDRPARLRRAHAGLAAGARWARGITVLGMLGVAAGALR